MTASLLEIARDPGIRHQLDQILGDYCHQFRNRLNSLKLSLYLVKRQSPAGIGSAWRSLENNYQQLEAQIDRVHTICRPLTLSCVGISLDLLIADRRRAWTDRLAQAGLSLDFHEPGTDSQARYDVEQLGSALDQLVAWRAGQGKGPGAISLSWWVDATTAHIRWSESETAHKAARFDTPDIAPWALPILARVVGEHGGRVELDDDQQWTLSITWPK